MQPHPAAHPPCRPPDGCVVAAAGHEEVAHCQGQHRLAVPLQHLAAGQGLTGPHLQGWVGEEGVGGERRAEGAAEGGGQMEAGGKSKQVAAGNSEESPCSHLQVPCPRAKAAAGRARAGWAASRQAGRQARTRTVLSHDPENRQPCPTASTRTLSSCPSRVRRQVSVVVSHACTAGSNSGVSGRVAGWQGQAGRRWVGKLAQLA